MKAPLFIGLSGIAGSGKDTFFEFLNLKLQEKDLKVKRYSFADLLKDEVAPWTLQHYKIDARDCSREDKEKIRPFLIFHGTHKRYASNGRHWVNRLNGRIKCELEENNNVPDIICITDIRYNHYPLDEVYWLKKEKKGVLIHINRYKEGKKRVAIIPEEEKHTPKVERAADYVVNVDTVEKSKMPEVITAEICPMLRWLQTSKQVNEGGYEWQKSLTQNLQKM